jgi:hypothetical protein
MASGEIREGLPFLGQNALSLSGKPITVLYRAGVRG